MHKITRLLCFSPLLAISLLSGCILDERGPLLAEYNAATAYDLVVPSNFPVPTLPDANPLTVEGIALGRKLFYEERLSGNNQISCASCHAQPFAFSDHGNTFSMGSNGEVGARNTIALMNLAWGNGYWWDGRSATLEDQVLQEMTSATSMNESIGNAVEELQATEDYPRLFKKAFGFSYISGDMIAKAIAQYERTMISANADFDKFQRGEPNAFSQAANRGMQIFTTDRGGCFHCHSLDLMRDGSFHNNGLDSVFDIQNYGWGAISGLSTDIGKFKTPDLHNVEVSAPYMHDGRFGTLEEVVEHYNSGIRTSATLDSLIQRPEGLFLTNQEKSDLVAFLKSLTDPTYLSDTRFSDPD